MESNRDDLINALRIRLDDITAEGKLLGEKVSDQQVAVLLGELQIAQLELEMQNDELSISAQRLELERSKFADFFNLAPVGYFILNQLGEVREANHTGLALLEVKLSKILNQRFQSFIAPENWERFYAFLQKMKPKGSKVVSELKMLLHTGKVIYTRIEGFANGDSTHQEIQYYVTVSDISEINAAAQELKNTTQRLELTLQASGMGTWTIDLDKNLLFLDHYGLSLLEIHPWDFDGSIKKFISYIYPPDQLHVKDKFLNYPNQLQQIHIEFRILGINGKIKHFLVQGQLVADQLPKLFFAGVIIDVTERKTKAIRAQELADEKQKLIINTTINAQEKERQEISSALHDSICQLLYGIRLNLQHIPACRKSPADFKNVHELLAIAIKETRNLSYELTPSIVRDFGLKDGILEMAKRLSIPGFTISCKLDSGIGNLPSELQLSIFRMIQELINNCIKHANASQAEIVISFQKQSLDITVSDNGVGFESGLEKSLHNGSGLRGIKNRIFLLNGILEVTSDDQGTKVNIKFNID